MFSAFRCMRTAGRAPRGLTQQGQGHKGLSHGGSWHPRQPVQGERGCLEALPPVPTLLTVPEPSSALLSMPEQLGDASPSSVWLAERYLGAAEL